MRGRALAIAWALSSYIRSGARCANHRWSVDVFSRIWDSIQHDEDVFFRLEHVGIGSAITYLKLPKLPQKIQNLKSPRKKISEKRVFTLFKPLFSLFGSKPFWNWGVGYLPKRKSFSVCEVDARFFPHPPGFSSCLPWTEHGTCSRGNTKQDLFDSAGAGGGALLCTGLCFWVGLRLIQVDSWSFWWMEKMMMNNQRYIHGQPFDWFFLLV